MSRVVQALLIGAVLGAGSSTEAAPVDDARAKAMAWLMLNQRGDGAWQGGAGLTVATTATALDGFANAGVKTFAYKAGADWLGNASAVSVDALARQSMSLMAANADVTPFINRLVAMRDPRQLSWGAYDKFGRSLPDTALALDAILRSSIAYPTNDIGIGLCQILPLQLSSGLWPYNAPDSMPGTSSGAVLPTAYTVLMLNAVAGKGYATVNCYGIPYNTATVINNGIAGLLTRQKADGGFGDDAASRLGDTAVAYLVLRTLYSSDTRTTNALNFLLTQQKPLTSGAAFGSWIGNAWLTALVFKALPSPATPLADTDGDGIPDVVESYTGTNPNVADSRKLAKSNGQAVVGITSPLALPPATVGTFYSTPLSASGGVSPYTFRLLSGRLPTGLSLAAGTGVISGTPATAGTFAFNYSTDPNSPPTVTKLAQITVQPASAAAITSAAITSAAITSATALRTAAKAALSDPFAAATEVFIAGASAEAPVVAKIAEALFTPDSLEVFRDDAGIAGSTPGRFYAAYRGVIRDTGTALDGQRVLIHFRGKGGSPYGVKPVALGLPIERLALGRDCRPSGTEQAWSCPVGQTVLAVPDLGVSDIDPRWLATAATDIGSALRQKQLNRLAKKIPHALVFGVAVTDNLDLASLPRTQALRLLRGTIPRGSFGAPELAGVTLCRTDGEFFAPLCGASASTATTLRMNATVDDTLECLSDAFGHGDHALGLLPLVGTPSDERRWHFIALGGMAPTVENAAAGHYPWSAPVTYLWRQAAVNGVPKPEALQQLLIRQIVAKAADPELLSHLSGVFALKTPAKTGPAFDPQRPITAVPRLNRACRPPASSTTQDNKNK